MEKDSKFTIVYIIVGVLIIAGVIVFQIYNRNVLLDTIKNALHEYFEKNNEHISSHDFNIDKVKIRCIGNNDAYVVDFNITFSDDTEDLNKLGATVYKNKDKWDVKGYGTGLTINEIEEYNFRCYE